jgi:hypothetical protein
LLAGRGMLVTYDLVYNGANAASVKGAISNWCEAHGCGLEAVTLTAGVRFRIVGEQQTIRQAVGMIRQWIRVAA